MMLSAFNAPKVYAERVKAVTRKWFDVLAIWLTEQIACSKGKSFTVRVVPARIVFIQFVNDCCSLLDQEYLTEKDEREKCLRPANLTCMRPLSLILH